MLFISCFTSYVLYKITSEWNADSVNWDNQPDFDAARPIYGTVGDYGAFYFDITDFFREWTSNTSLNYGVLIKKVSEDIAVDNKGLFTCSTYPIGSSETIPSVDLTYLIPDLVVNRIKFYSDWDNKENAVVTDICNIGNVDYITSNNYPFFYWGNGVGEDGVITDSNTTLRPGKCEEFYFTQLDDGESFAYSVYVDQDNNVVESNDGNNIKTQAVYAPSPINLADLMIENISFSPLSPAINQDTIITVQGRNIGAGEVASALSFDDYYFSANDFEIISVDEIPSPSSYDPLRSRDPFYYQFTVRFTQSGEKDVKFTVDSSNILTEVNEDNNSKTRTITVMSDIERPDLTVTDIKFVSANNRVNEEGSLYVSVKNLGAKLSSTQGLYNASNNFTANGFVFTKPISAFLSLTN